MVLSDTSDELLKISLNKFWGCGPNEVGNYCIVGHNYDGKDIMFGKLNRIKNGDIVELEDSSGRKLSYKVYNIFIGPIHRIGPFFTPIATCGAGT